MQGALEACSEKAMETPILYPILPEIAEQFLELRRNLFLIYGFIRTEDGWQSRLS